MVVGCRGGPGGVVGGSGYGEAVQREWQRLSATSPVTLNNAARTVKVQSSSSLNGRHLDVWLRMPQSLIMRQSLISCSRALDHRT